MGQITPANKTLLKHYRFNLDITSRLPRLAEENFKPIMIILILNPWLNHGFRLMLTGTTLLNVNLMYSGALWREGQQEPRK